MREQSGALAPPSYDVHKARHSRKGGIMATVFSGKPSRSTPTMSIELSLEMNRKMQSVLEDTLLKNITLKVCALLYYHIVGNCYFCKLVDFHGKTLLVPPNNVTPPKKNFLEKTFPNSHKTLKFAESFSPP